MSKGTREEKYKVRAHLVKNGKSIEIEAKIEFAYDTDDYGNGYYMHVESKEEPFGGQLYDIRYDKDFHEDYLMEYIMNFYSRRFDGKPTQYDVKWKLIGIHIYEYEDVD